MPLITMRHPDTQVITHIAGGLADYATLCGVAEDGDEFSAVDTNVYRKFPSLDFGDESPMQRGSEAFSSGLMRAEICDREFFSLVNANARTPGFTMKALGDHRTLACRDWIKGWDKAQKEVN